MGKITLKVDGHTGTAEVKWIEENQWSVAHYEAFISVPFQNSRWENLFVYDKEKLSECRYQCFCTEDCDIYYVYICITK